MNRIESTGDELETKKRGYFQRSHNGNMLTHETGWEGRVRANFSINLDATLFGDQRNLTTSQSVLQTVAQKHDQRQALTELVWTSGRTRSL
jgi:hypothetical protein